MNDEKTIGGAALELLELASSRVWAFDCMRDCKHRREGQKAYQCPHFNPRDNGEIRCYGWRDESMGD